MKKIVFLLLALYLVGMVGVVGVATTGGGEGGALVTESEKTAAEQKINSGTLDNIEPRVLNDPRVWETAKANQKALNTLSDTQINALGEGEDGDQRRKDVVEKDLDPKGETAKNWLKGPKAKENAKALKQKPEKVNNLPSSDVADSVKKGDLPKEALNKLEITEWKEKDIKTLVKGIADQPNTYNRRDSPDFFNNPDNKEALRKTFSPETPDNVGPSNPQNPPRGGGEGAGGGGQPKGGQQQQEGGKPQGDPAQMLSGLGGLLQGIASIMGAMKQQEQPEQQKDQNVVQQQKNEQQTCAKAGGISCSPPNINKCDPPQTEAVADTRQCCIKGSRCVDLRDTSQGQNAVAEVAQAKSQSSQVQFGITGQDGKTITSGDGQTKQDMTLLDKNQDKVVPKPAEIQILNGKATNLYTLKGTQTGVRDFYGVFVLDNIGLIKISVAEVMGAVTLDKTNIVLWELPGTTVYDAAHDTYETDTRVYAPQYGVWIKAAEQKPQQVTGKFASSFPTAGATFGHGALSELLKNAIDTSLAAKGDVDVIVMTKGTEDIDLLGNIGFFPVMIRNLAKGSTNIVYELGVGVEKRYLIKDSQYEYKIVKEEGTTKVKTKNGKIIEDSGGQTVRTLSAKQRRLLYEQ